MKPFIGLLIFFAEPFCFRRNDRLIVKQKKAGVESPHNTIYDNCTFRGFLKFMENARTHDAQCIPKLHRISALRLSGILKMLCFIMSQKNSRLI